MHLESWICCKQVGESTCGTTNRGTESVCARPECGHVLDLTCIQSWGKVKISEHAGGAASNENTRKVPKIPEYWRCCQNYADDSEKDVVHQCTKNLSEDKICRRFSCGHVRCAKCVEVPRLRTIDIKMERMLKEEHEKRKKTPLGLAKNWMEGVRGKMGF